MEWVVDVLAELAAMENVRLLSRSTVFGYYDHNFLAVVERLTGHLPTGSGTGVRERLWRVRARRVVMGAGAIERPLVFANNDRPGVMLASAVSTYVNRYAVAPGKNAVVFTNNDSAYYTVLDLIRAGVAVAALIDVRPDPRGMLARRVRDEGVELIGGHAVVDVTGVKRVEGVDVMRLTGGGDGVVGLSRTIDCDLVAVSGGWNPAVHLHSQSGARARFSNEKSCFVPGSPVQAERSVGACSGSFRLDECLAEGFAAGAEAAEATGFGDGAAATLPLTSDVDEEGLRTMWLVPSRKPVGRGPKQFVDLQNDTTTADIKLASLEGYHSIEHVKRYTALGFGTDQGKLGNINGAAILASMLGNEISKTGTTTFRPAYTPVTFGAVAGRDVKMLYEPVRKTALHQWHETANAEFENVGQWKRPWYYPQRGETMEEAVNRECLAVRSGVGLLDASTLGKIDVQGPDAAEFLDLVYTNDWKKLAVGRCRYGLMLGEDGMVMDDGVGSRLGEHHFVITTTTGGAAHVLAWLERWLQTEWPNLQVHLTSVTEHWATLSIAGPKSRALITELCRDINFSHKAFPFMSYREGTIADVTARVFRISFTGELSYEINVPANYARHVWERLVDAGVKYGITPYGTEAMHVLRAEKGFIIVGQDTDGSVTPADLGMQWIVSKNKDFIGKRSLARADCTREDRKQLVGLVTHSPNGVLPEGAQLVDDPSVKIPMPMIGHVSSSYFSACLGRSVALALVKGGRARTGETVFAPLADGKVLSATITRPLFYDPTGEKQDV
jgi:sarcosine oxidase subunit alpha